MRIVLVILLVLTGCEYVAVQNAPKKEASASRTPAALEADKLFWATLHGGNYAGIDKALEAKTAAYLENPNDAVTAAHVGWLHIWRLTERSRLDAVSPTVTDDAVLARKYFQEAVALNPGEARYLGFLAVALQVEGTIHKDEKLVRQGHFRMLEAVKAWPEFNLFTAGVGPSRLPPDSPRFKEALENQWRALDLCVGEKVDRKEINYSKYMQLETKEGPKRVCWNSWIAPHNFEGFFLFHGDLLVKSGDWQTAQKVYASARLSRDYGKWKFREVLEERIREAPANVARFNAAPDPQRKPKVVMVAGSSYSCVSCHQE